MSGNSWGNYFRKTTKALPAAIVDDGILLLDLESSSQKKALDLGCGAGQNSNYLSTQGFQVTGIDRSKEAMGFWAESENVTFICGDILNLSTMLAANDKYDLVVASYILPFIPRIKLSPLNCKYCSACAN